MDFSQSIFECFDLLRSATLALQEDSGARNRAVVYDVHQMGINGAHLVVLDNLIVKSIVFNHFRHVRVREVLQHVICFVLEDLIVLLSWLSRFAFLDHCHIEACRVKAKVLRKRSQILADGHSLDFLSVEMRFDQDSLTISDQLLDFEGAHDTLHALVFEAMRTTDLAHVVAILFGNISAHFRLLLDDVVENIRYRC